MLEGEKILVTGASGLVARPLAEALAAGNEVWAASLFNDAEQGVRAEFEALGMKTLAWPDMNEPLEGLPEDISHVFHAAVLRDTRSFDEAMDANATGAAGLMIQCRNAEAFLFVSAGGMYRLIAPDHLHAETDPIGAPETDLAAYQIGKVASEGAVRALSRILGLPTVIIRLNVAYGPNGWGGVPIMFLKKMIAGEEIDMPPTGSSYSSPIHTDDIVRMVPLLWEKADVPPLVVNLAGDEMVSDREMFEYIAELTGVPARFRESRVVRGMSAAGNTRRLALIGPCQVGWREGLRRTVAAHFPDLVKAN